jgi:hypothetical protein
MSSRNNYWSFYGVFFLFLLLVSVNLKIIKLNVQWLYKTDALKNDNT